MLAEAEKADIQKALRLSQRENIALRNGFDEELQLALELSRIEAGHSEDTYDPDTFGETSRMGAMRNNGCSGGARASVPDSETGGWNDQWEEPPPPYEP